MMHSFLRRSGAAFMLVAATMSAICQALADDAPPSSMSITHTVNAYASFHPDGTQLIFQSNASGGWQLYTIRIDGSGLKPLFTSQSNDITPVWSPTGQQILFVSERDGNREVYVCDADGANQRNISAHPATDIHPLWSADGKKLLFSSNRNNSDNDNFDIYEMNIDGSGVRQITSGKEIDTYASWSPDGTRIAMRRVIGDGMNSEVFVIDADGTNAVNLSNAPECFDGWPMWSPDGTSICFAGGPDDGNKYLFLVKPDGTAKMQITFPWISGSPYCYDTQPTFSPDGKTIAFTRYRPTSRHESAEIMTISAPQVAHDPERSEQRRPRS